MDLNNNLQIVIRSSVLEGVKSAVANSAEERCGFLFGFDFASCRRIIQFVSVNNAAAHNKERTFEIAPSDYLKAEGFAEENNFQLLGVFHSHPNCPPIPSEYDRIAAQPFFSYMILSTKGGSVDDVRSWRLNDDRKFEEEFFN